MAKTKSELAAQRAQEIAAKLAEEERAYKEARKKQLKDLRLAKREAEEAKVQEYRDAVFDIANGVCADLGADTIDGLDAVEAVVSIGRSLAQTFEISTVADADALKGILNQDEITSYMREELQRVAHERQAPAQDQPYY